MRMWMMLATFSAMFAISGCFPGTNPTEGDNNDDQQQTDDNGTDNNGDDSQTVSDIPAGSYTGTFNGSETRNASGLETTEAVSGQVTITFNSDGQVLNPQTNNVLAVGNTLTYTFANTTYTLTIQNINLSETNVTISGTATATANDAVSIFDSVPGTFSLGLLYSVSGTNLTFDLQVNTSGTGGLGNVSIKLTTTSATLVK